MSFRWSPLPHVGLADGGDAEQIALNATLYLMGLGLLGACLWLACLAWQDRAR